MSENINYSRQYDYERKYGIILNNLHDIDIIQWYEYLFKTPNNRKLKQLPYFIYLDDNNLIKIWKYALNEKIGIKTREDLLKLDKKTCTKHRIIFYNNSKKRLYTLYEIITKTFPEYNIKPWEIKTLQTGYFNNEVNIKEALTWLINKNNFTIEDILNNKITGHLLKTNGMRMILEWFGGSNCNLNIWICKNIYNMEVCNRDFYRKRPKYYFIKENADYELKKYVNNILRSNKDEDMDFIRSILIPSCFQTKQLMIDKKTHLIRSCGKFYGEYNFFKWLNELFPEICLKEEDFKIIVSSDGKTKLNSKEEKYVYDYIYNSLGITSIQAIGLKRNKEFYNEKEGEYYYPDFKILNYLNKKLKKPIYIEYYGLYHPKYEYDKIIGSYINKVKRKNEYYKSNKDIYFIDLYPCDLRNNFQGLREKLSLFILF